jgi:perosamine synthetase
MKIPHNKITYDEKEVQAVSAVVESGMWVCGKITNNLEEKLAKTFGMTDGVCVGSGLAALRLSLLALKVDEGDEVLIPAYSCVALANAVLSIGAIPVPVDSDSDTYNMSVEEAAKKKTEKTRAVIAVNSFGLPADIKALKALNVPVIEDCSHGFPVLNKTQPDSLKGDIAVFSFYATKLIAGGEGGAVLCKDKALADFCRDWRDYTDKTPDKHRLNDKITDIESAIVLQQLNKLTSFLENRAQIAERYSDCFRGYKSFDLPVMSDRRVWYRYIVSWKENSNIDNMISRLEEEGISARSPVENWIGQDIKKYPNAEKQFASALSLPLYPSLKQNEQAYICKKLEELIQHG